MNAQQTSLEDWQDYLEASLATQGGPTTLVRVYKQTASTQDIAKTFAPRNALVVADQQTAGRGRLGRSWLSSPGSSVLMSMCRPVDKGAATHDKVSMSVGVALARAVERLAPDVAVRLKWPNDILVDGRKLAGILIESAGNAFVIGIGLNVTPEACPDPTLRHRTTSLAELRRSVDRLHVIEMIVTELNQAFSSSNTEQMLKDWRLRAALGESYTFEHHGRRITGQAVDLDPDHGLIVRRDTGEIIVLPAATTSVVS